MQLEAVPTSGVHVAFEDLEGVDGATATVGSVLDDQHRGRGEVVVFGADGGIDGLGREDALQTSKQLGLHSAHGGRCTGLVVVRVGAGFHEHLVAGLGPAADGDLVGHGARRREHRCLHARELCGMCLQGHDAGIVSQDVVADLGRHHGRHHGGGGACHGVAAQIDGHGASRTPL